MKERSTKLSSNFIYNSAAAVGSAAAVAGILFVLYWFAASSSLPFMWNILFFFHPLNQGLNDHTAYGVIMIYTLSSLLFVSLLINQRAKKVERHTLPWLFAASIGFFYGSVTLLEMKGRIEYALINYFWTVLLLQVAIIVAGHLVYRSRLHR